MKRFISLLLCTLMLLSAFSFASFADEEEWALPFTDVKEGAWYYDGIAFCFDMGIVSGMTETTFVPNGTLTRAQFVQILAMVDGVDLAEYKDGVISFVDVKPDHWYNALVCWAVEQGFVAGLSADRFGPNEKITREQLARLLYLYAEKQGCDVSVLADLSGYTDKPSDWAYTQVQWAVAAGIISGMDETTLAPRASATRAQACRMIMSFYDFLWYGNRDTSGAFAAIVEYIKANAEDTSDPNYYGVYEEYDGYFVAMEYYPRQEEFSIAYLAEPYEFTEQGTAYTGYRESGALYAYSLASMYDYSYYRESENGEDYMNTFGTLGIDSYYEEYAGTNGFTPEELAAGTEKTVAVVRERIAAILAEADMTLEDFFLPYEDEEYDPEIQQMYDALVRHICNEGVEYPDGKHIGLITDNGNEAYVTEYVYETGEICLVYVTEPIPGGTDIFDTSYRERMIFLPDIFTESLWWSYSYESEDGTVKINATGTEADEDNYANLTFEGISEDEAKAKLDAAMENTAFYFLSLIIDAASYITYDSVVDYVNSNGVAFEGGVDLVKDEGDRGYVAEYDPENDALYLVYVTEPIPGGSDIFDTSYREKAVLAIDPPLADEYFFYIYESEDGSVTISAEGYYDGYEAVFESLEFNGVSEEEATAKISTAVEEAMGYFYEIANDAAA